MTTILSPCYADVVFFHGKHISKTDLTDVLLYQSDWFQSPNVAACSNSACAAIKVSFKNICLGPARGILQRLKKKLAFDDYNVPCSKKL